MRRVVLLALLAIALPRVAIAADGTDVRDNGNGDSIEYSGGDPGHSGNSGGGGGGTSGSSDGGYYEEHPYLSTAPDGSTCIATEYRRYDTKDQAVAAAEADDQRWQRLSKDYPNCPETPAPAGR